MSHRLHNLFFINENQIQNSRIILTGQEFHHIKNVLRKKSGETVYFTDGKGFQYETQIEQILPNALVIKVIEKRSITAQNIINLDLGLVPLKSARTDFIIEKGTELGVRNFIFFISQFAVIKNLNSHRLEHFKNIALSAMLQSQQYCRPEIILADNIVTYFKNYDMVVIGDQTGTDKISPGLKNILLLIGPEGGFSLQEMQIFQDHGVKFISFSKNRLRSETAAMAGIILLTTYYMQ